jgi:PhnB protein
MLTYFDRSVESMTNVVPEGYHTITPWLINREAGKLIDFLVTVFDAVELGRMEVDGVIGHAEVRIGDSVVMLFDSRPNWPATPGFLRLYVADDAEVLRRAVGHGSTVVTEPTELFFGDRVSRFRDPFGNLWWIHQHLLDVTPALAEERLRDPKFIKAMAYVAGAELIAPPTTAPPSAPR